VLIKTDRSVKEWQSPDGQRVIWKIRLIDKNGKKYVLRTYSPDIAEPRFEGEVETYLDDKQRRFVRLRDPKPQQQPTLDRNAEIRAQFAIKTAVQMLAAPSNPDVEVPADLIEYWAGVFYDMVPKIATRGGQ
jgi:hypothetical protein